MNNKWTVIIDFAKSRSNARSFRDLADKAGLEHSTLSRIRNGSRKPHIDTLTKLGAAIGMTGPELWDMANQ